MAKNYDDIGGVWRTIGGRRVFIKTGQSLGEAMKASGKFNYDDEYDRAHGVYKKQEKEIDELNKKKHREAIKRENQERLNEFIEKQKEAGERLNEKARKNAEDDIKFYLDGNSENWDSDGDFIRELAAEYGLETEETKKMFNDIKRTNLENKYQKYVNKNLKNEDYQKQEQIVHEAKNEVDRLKRQLSLLEDDDTYGSPDYDDTKYALQDAEDRYREEKAKYDKMVSKSSNEDKISKVEFERASKIDDKLDRAIQMQVADDIGKELDDDDIRFRAEHYIKNNYNGNATDDEIFEKLKAEYKNRGWYKNEGVKNLSGDYERDNKGRIVSQEEYDNFREAYKKDLISKEDYRNDNYDALKDSRYNIKVNGPDTDTIINDFEDRVVSNYEDTMTQAEKKAEIDKYVARYKAQGEPMKNISAEDVKEVLYDNYRINKDNQKTIDDNKSISQLNKEMLGDTYKGKGETPSLIYSNNRRIDIANNENGGKTAIIWKDGKIERKTNLPDNVKGDKTKDYFDKYLKDLDDKSNSINNSLRRKGYQKYLKEHPNSKISFEDYMKNNK